MKLRVRTIVILILYVYFLQCVNSLGDPCPSGCMCVFTDTDCTGLDLQTIPDRATLRGYTKFLRLDRNLITRVSRIDLPQLQELYISNNKVKMIDPLALFDLSKLEILDLSHNDLQLWPSRAFQPLSLIRKVNVAYNRIIHLGAFTFEENLSTKLQFLNFSHNEIESIDNQAFSDLNSVEHLDLSFNRLTTISPDMFRTMKSLKYLNLGHNAIRTTAYQKWPMIVSPMLQELWLDHNSMTSSEESYLWFDTPMLKMLNMGYNNIKRLPLRPLDFLSSLEELHLESTYGFLITSKPNCHSLQ